MLKNKKKKIFFFFTFRNLTFKIPEISRVQDGRLKKGKPNVSFVKRYFKKKTFLPNFMCVTVR
jgi:hypothetical protein